MVIIRPRDIGIVSQTEKKRKEQRGREEQSLPPSTWLSISHGDRPGSSSRMCAHFTCQTAVTGECCSAWDLCQGKLDVSFPLKDRAEEKGSPAKASPWILSSSPAQHISP